MPVQKSRRGAMSSRRAEDMPLDPADVEDIRLRIEAHQRATEMEAASAKAFRSECECAHGEFLRAISRLDEERQVRHAEQLEEMDVTYARARLAGPAVSAELLALRRLARDIARGLAAREAGRGGTRREDDGVVVRPEKDAFVKKKHIASDSDSAANEHKNASDRFAMAALERAAAEAEKRARASYDERVVNDMRSRRVAMQKTHDRETFELAAARADAERTFFDARNKAAETFRGVFSVYETETKTYLYKTSSSSSSERNRRRETVSVAAVTAAARSAVRAAAAAARAVADRSESAFLETKRAAVAFTKRARDGIFSSAATAALGDVDWDRSHKKVPKDTRFAAEKARRVERAARASFAKTAKRKGGEKAEWRTSPFDARVHSTRVATKRRASSETRGRSDERRAGVLVFGPDDAAFGDAANTTTPSRGYADARVDDDDDGDDDGGARATVSNASSSSDETDGGSSDDEERSARHAAPSNRHRRASLARARVGEARAAALGARGDDSKGFGVLGEEGVAFADFGPAGRERGKKKRVSLFSRGDADVAAEEVSAEADENRDRDETSRLPTGGVSFHGRLSQETETFVIPVTVDDGFGLARCRGSGLRLPPPPASLPRAAEAPSLSRVIHDRRVAASRARGALTTIREARRGLGEKTWR